MDTKEDTDSKTKIDTAKRNEIIALWYERGSGLRDGKYYYQICLRCLEDFCINDDNIYDLMCQTCGKIVCEECSNTKFCNECETSWRCCRGKCFLEENECSCGNYY